MKQTPRLLKQAGFVLAVGAMVFASGASHAASPSVCHPLEMREPLPGDKSVAPETVQRLLDDAERAYRAKEFTQAKAAYIAVLELTPSNEAAWLRLGNIQQLLGCKELALFAYRHLLPKTPDKIQEVQARGVLNLALIAGEQLTEALTMLSKANLPEELVLLHTELKSRYARSAPPAVHTVSAPAAANPTNPRDRARHASQANRPDLPLVQYVGGVQGSKR
jgi:tetratricopeptide (TPR) repeat protein